MMWITPANPHDHLNALLTPFAEMVEKLNRFVDGQRESIGLKQLAIDDRNKEIIAFNNQIGEHNTAIQRASGIRTKINDLLSPAANTKESV